MADGKPPARNSYHSFAAKPLRNEVNMERLAKIYRENENFRLILKLFFILLMSRLFMLVLMVIYNVYMGTDRSIAFLMNQWDAKRYQFMIDNGYTFPLDTDPQANWAFFPMYVMVCRFVKMLTFGVMDTYWVGMTVSTVCIFIAAFTAVKYMSLVRGGRSEDYLLIPLLMFAGPYSFYFSSVYTEAMFVLFIALFFYAAAKKKYLWAGFAAAFASATRIVGCLLVFALIVEMYLDLTADGGKLITWAKIKSFIVQMLKLPEHIFAVMLCPFGAFCYMTFLRFFCGDVWAYKNVQIAWREDTYFPVVGVLWKACTGQIEPRYTYMGWFCIGIFAVYGYMLYRKYYSMAVFGIISLLVPLTSHVMSTCRFTVGSFVVYMGVYEILKSVRPKIRTAILIFFAFAQIWLLFMWYNSDCWLM